jgi:hypothetical protein
MIATRQQRSAAFTSLQRTDTGSAGMVRTPPAKITVKRAEALLLPQAMPNSSQAGTLWLVAQNCILPYRGFSIRMPRANSSRLDSEDAWPNPIRRNSRLGICATWEGHAAARSGARAIESCAPKSAEPDDLDYAPFHVSFKPGEGGSHHGGLGKVHQTFRERLPKRLDELNEVLVV